MKKESLSFDYALYSSALALSGADLGLLKLAQETIQTAYAPYSGFLVGAALMLENGKTVVGTNQENAASPAGLCAERTALSAASSLYPGIPLLSIAISYFNTRTGKSIFPVTPCGICRQSLLEYEIRQKQPIRVILGGMDGPVWILEEVKSLLPLYFSGSHLE